MPKTWDDGPPRTRKDAWLLGRRRVVDLIASVSLVNALVAAENWQGVVAQEELDRQVKGAQRVLDLMLEDCPRSDGKAWDEPPETEEDGWVWERLNTMLPAVCGLVARRQRGIGEAWKEDSGISDEDIRAAITFAKRLQATVDKAVPRIG